MSRGKRIAGIALIVVLIILAVAVIGFLAWANNPAQPMSEALPALEDTGAVTVEQENGWWTFTPAGEQSSTGFIFYPGALVDPRAYAPMAQAIADAGYLTVIVPMPLNLAVFNVNAADSVIAAYPEIDHWVIGGHSLGGAMAAQYAGSHDENIDGLALLAAYPATGMTGANIDVVSIYASNDGLADTATVEASASLLPADARFVEIEGGNHAQFGYYGAQSGDNPAAISREAQQAQMIAAVLELLAQVSGQPA